MFKRILRKLVTDPFGLVRRTIAKTFLDKSRYCDGDDYNALNYWKDRFTKYHLSLKGPGDEGLSEDANQREYTRAAETFETLCVRESVNYEKVRILDIGCGTGFYTDLLAQLGCRHYTGMDITDVLFTELQVRFPTFRLVQQDVTEKAIAGEFDLVIMIDVAQHIVDEHKFSRTMQHIKTCLSREGLFIVTAALSKVNRLSPFYMKNRSLKDFQREFPGFAFGDPLPFRDKYILSIRETS